MSNYLQNTGFYAKIVSGIESEIKLLIVIYIMFFCVFCVIYRFSGCYLIYFKNLLCKTNESLLGITLGPKTGGFKCHECA